MRIKNVAFASLLFTNLGLVAAELGSSRLVTPDFYNVIIQPNAVGTGATGYTLSAPGRYLLATDIAYSPTSNGSTAFSITGNNIILDLNGFSIYNGNSATNLTGIQITGNNVTVRNGQITGLDVTSANSGGASFTTAAAGIAINFSSSALTASTQNVNLENITVSSCTSSNSLYAFMLYGSSTYHSSSINLINCNAYNNSCTTGSGEAAGFGLYYCDAVNFTGCSANNNLASDNDASGFRSYYSTSCTFNDCYAEGNSTGGGNTYGFRIDNGCSRFQFTNCHALYQTNSYFNSASWAIGFYLYTASACCLKNCSAIGQTATAGDAADNGPSAHGFYINNTSTGIYLDNCLALYNTSAYGGAYGFKVNSTNCTVSFNRCQSILNQGNAGTALSGGFHDGGSASYYTGLLAVGNYDVSVTTYYNYTVTPASGSFPVESANTGSYAAITAPGPQNTYYNLGIKPDGATGS